MMSRLLQHVCCPLPGGVPTIRGRGGGYYLFPQGGRRLLILNGTKGQRIRINGAIDVVVLEVGGGSVEFGVLGPGEVFADRERPYRQGE